MTIKRRTHRRSGNAVFEVAEILDWKPSLIVQVGVGSHAHETEVFAEEWPDVPLVGFEPNPDSFEQIKKRYPGTLIQKAVGRSERNVSFYSKKGHDNGSSLLRVGKDKSKLTKHSVEMTMLDALNKSRGFGHNGKDILLWLDCEGTELAVLIGAKGYFLNQVQMINVEMTGNPSDEGWCSPLDVNKLLRLYGFYLTWVHTIRTKIGQYDAVYVRGDIFNPNICCCPTEIERWKKEHE